MAARRQKRTDERWPAALRMRAQVEKAVELTLNLLERGERERARDILLELVEDEAVPEAVVAKMLGVSERTLQQWRSSQTGPAFFRISDGPKGGVRYSRFDVRAYREKRKISAGFVPDSD